MGWLHLEIKFSQGIWDKWYLPMLLSVFCPDLPLSKMIFSATLRTHSHWQACRRNTNCLEAFILVRSLPIISIKAEKLQSGRQKIQTCSAFTSFLPTRKHLPFHASKCTSLLLHSPDAQEQPQKLSQEKIPSSHSLNQFRTEEVYQLRNI